MTRSGEWISKCVLLTFFALLAPLLALADVGFDRHPRSGDTVLTIKGRIGFADVDELRSRLEELDTTGKRLHMNSVRLNSGGGEGRAGVALGRLIRERRLNTFVGPRDDCASACVYVLIGGVVRMAFGTIFVHRFRLNKQGVSDDEIRAMIIELGEERRKYVAEMGISPLLADAIDNTPSWGLRRLQRQEVLHWGLHGINHVDEEILARETARLAGIPQSEFNDFYVDMLDRCKREAARFERLVYDCLVRISHERKAKSKGKN